MEIIKDSKQRENKFKVIKDSINLGSFLFAHFNATIKERLELLKWKIK